jgi:uncharacterized lipoprotein YajG
MRRSLLLLLSMLLLTTGCALTTAHLDVHLADQETRRGPLSSAPPLQFQLPEFTDSRRDPERIGYKKNQYGMNMADILTKRPVPEIVREAVQLTLQKNGHSLEPSAPVRVDGDVQQFWFEWQQNFWTIEFMGTAECKLKLIDAASGSVVYEASYSGHYNEKTAAGGLDGTWERVMNQALARLVESIAMDDALTQALSARQPVVAAE